MPSWPPPIPAMRRSPVTFEGRAAEEGRTTEAIPLLEKNLADYERVLSTDHSGTRRSCLDSLFAQDRALILAAMNQAVSRLYACENQEPGEGEGADAVA